MKIYESGQATFVEMYIYLLNSITALKKSGESSAGIYYAFETITLNWECFHGISKQQLKVLREVFEDINN